MNAFLRGKKTFVACKNMKMGSKMIPKCKKFCVD